MNFEKMTGLEIMQAIVREELPHPTMTKSIPVEVIKVEKEVCCSCPSGGWCYLWYN